MLSSKRNQKLVAVVLLIVIIGGAFLWRYRSTRTITSASNSSLDRDMQLIVDPGASEESRHNALVRLSENQNSAAREADLARAKSEDKIQRQSAAKALGFFSDAEATQALAALADDREQDVRVSALQGLRYRKNPERSNQFFAKVLANTAATPSEKVLSLGGTLQNLPQGTLPEIKQPMIDQIFKLANDNINDSEVVIFALREVGSSATMDPRLDSLLRQIYSKTSALKKNNVPSKSAHQAGDKKKRAELFDTALHLIHIVCPKDRSKILEKVLAGESDLRILRSALQELTYMEQIEARSILEHAVKQNWIKPQFQPSPQALEARLVGPDLCARTKNARQ